MKGPKRVLVGEVKGVVVSDEDRGGDWGGGRGEITSSGERLDVRRGGDWKMDVAQKAWASDDVRAGGGRRGG